jgi:D-sedoheptulose 7-phosphate isomerase
VWALTGPSPNDLAARAHDALCIDAPSTATIQELHLVAVHLLCGAVDRAVAARRRRARRVLEAAR